MGWSEPSPQWKARAAELTAGLTKLEPASGCVEGPGHVIGALMGLFGYNPKNYNRKTRIYLSPVKWQLLNLSAEALGLCVECGEAPAKPGERCAECLASKVEYNAEARS
jgi:hypothetical protein